MSNFKKRNTIFNKTILIFTAMSFVSFLITGLLLSNFMVSYSVNESLSQMSQTANLIDTTVSGIITMYSEQGANGIAINQEHFNRIARTYYDMSKSHVYIIDASNAGDLGRVVVACPPVKDSLIEPNLNYVNGNYYLSAEQYTNVLNSESGVIIDTDYYKGLYKGSNTKWVTIAKRLETKLADGETVIAGVVIISRPFKNVYISRTTVLNYFLLSMCVSLLLSLLVAAFFTKKITGPIDHLKLAAKRVSNGDFCGRIEYSSNDDMGELIDSFNSMTRSLKLLDKMRNDFIANVSHELRTPITTIGGFIDGIIDGTIPEEKREHYLAIVKNEVKRMNDLVNDQLQIARLQQNMANLKKTTFDINEMIREEIIKNEKNIEDKQIEIEVEFEHERQNVFAEKESISRVIINLLNNAIKFTPEKGIITIGTLSKKGDVEIYIKDTGVGIPADDLERIFERYFKSDRSRAVDKEGTGLGLAICRKIINAHNYQIKAFNNAESGAKFVFWLKGI